MKNNLKTLDEHNYNAASFQMSMIKDKPTPNGIECPNCGEELMDSQPNITLTTFPAKKNVNCSKCDYTGYRIAQI